MQTGNISFCDKIALNVKSDTTKRQVLAELEGYGVKILCKHFDVFHEEISMNRISRNPYMFCLKSNGNPYYMFLTRINNINTCVMIDKKIQQGYFLPRMIIVHKMFNETLFTNTLFDGEMVRDRGGKWIYLINDILVHNDKHLADTNLIKRHNLVYRILQEQHVNDNRFFATQVKRLFPVRDFETAVRDFQHTLPYTTRGVLFKPMLLKFKDILYNFDDSLIKNTRRTKFSETNQYIDRPVLAKRGEPVGDGRGPARPGATRRGTADAPPQMTNRTLTVKNTDTPDVYLLYDGTDYVGHAGVNTMAVSKMMYQLFKSSALNESFRVDCVFNTTFNKWTPVKVAK